MNFKNELRNTLTFEISQNGIPNEKFLNCLRKIVWEFEGVQISKEDVPWAIAKVATEDEYHQVVKRMNEILYPK